MSIQGQFFPGDPNTKAYLDAVNVCLVCYLHGDEGKEKIMSHRSLAAMLCLALGGLLLLIGCSSPSAGGATAAQPTTTTQATKPSAEATKPFAQAQATPTGQAASKAPTAAAVNLDGCSLLTTDEVAAAIGKPVQAVTLPTGDSSTVACDYTDPANRGNRFVSTTVYVLTPAGAKGAHEATKGGGRDQTAISGLGDDAYWDNTLGMLSVLKGRYVVGMSVTADATADRMKAAQAMASKILARLP